MPTKWRGLLPWLAAVFVVNVAVIVAAAFLLSQGVVDQQELTALALVAVSGAAAMFAVSWKIVDYQVVRSIRRMAADLRAIAHGSTLAGVDAEKLAVLAPLPEAVNILCAKAQQARTELKSGLAAATRQADENAARLAAILNDLHEGVVVCNMRHQVVLYNQLALDMLRGVGQLGLGRSLFETVSRQPVLHSLEVLTHRPDLAARGNPFLAGSADDAMLLQARMTIIRDEDGQASGYVVTMVDAGPQIAALAGRDALLREVAEGLESPLLRLKLAADKPAIVERECGNIALAIKRVTEGYQRALSGWWPMADIHSADLLGLVARRLEATGIKGTVTGVPTWLHGDSHSLVLAVESLVAQVIAGTGGAALDLSAGSDENGAWIDLLWPGEPIPARRLDSWMGNPLPSLGGMTVRDVLDHHAGGDLVQEDRDGSAVLRLPMRRGVEVHAAPRQNLPQRPEFYDLSLLREAASHTGALGGRPLRSLTFVVFDCETTGLQPSQGDQIISIAGVRVVNGRILSGESFSRLVHPGKAIPKESIRFHGITDDMVKDQPQLPQVLPQFHTFAADAVLVAHNAAFDMKFLRMREKECGLRFDHPVLDTMLFSNYLDGTDQGTGHSLDDICQRFAIEITDRHTALGDAIVTAAVLLRQIDMLESRGIHTLDQAVKALNLSVVLRERQSAF